MASLRPGVIKLTQTPTLYIAVGVLYLIINTLLLHGSMNTSYSTAATQQAINCTTMLLMAEWLEQAS